MSQSVIRDLTLYVDQSKLVRYVNAVEQAAESKRRSEQDKFADDKYLERLSKSRYYVIEANVDGKPGQKLGYLIIQEANPKYHTIEYVETLMRGRDIALNAIQAYEEHFKVNLIPHEIIRRSVDYWIRFFYAKNYIRCNSGRDAWSDLSVAIKDTTGLDIDTDLKWSPLKTEYRLFTKFMKSNNAPRAQCPLARYRKHKSIIQMKLIEACTN